MGFENRVGLQVEEMDGDVYCDQSNELEQVGGGPDMKAERARDVSELVGCTRTGKCRDVEVDSC